MDTLIAARRAGKTGRVVGVDFSEGMLERARCAVQEAGADNVELLLAGAEGLPLPTASVDVALVNGIFNLNPTRARIFRELARVVRPGGSVYAAEIVLASPLSAQEKSGKGKRRFPEGISESRFQRCIRVTPDPERAHKQSECDGCRSEGNASEFDRSRQHGNGLPRDIGHPTAP